MRRSVLVTGASRRIGAEIACTLHAAGYNVVIHFRESSGPARVLEDELNGRRPDSARTLQADLLQTADVAGLAERAVSAWGRIDALVNNASAFYPTPIAKVSEAQWDELITCNMKAPFFLSRALAPELMQRLGSIVNIVDIHALRPREGFSVYSLSKAGLAAMTQSLARELAPSVRVNGVAPGAILWPEAEMDEAEREQILSRIPLQKTGQARDIAQTVHFLLGSDYITGQMLSVDGGRSLWF